MAYKFQLGAAKLGGNLTTEDITTDADGIISGSIGRFTHLSCSANSLVLGGTTINESEIAVLDNLVEANINGANDFFVFWDADDSKFKKHEMNLGITTGLLAADAVTSAKIADDAIGSEHIAADAVTGAKIADNAVDSEHIAASSLDEEHYSTGSIRSNHLFGAVANAKLANSSLTYTAGNGLSGGGAVSLGGSATLNLDITGSALGIRASKLCLSASVAGQGLIGISEGVDGQLIDFLDVQTDNSSIQIAGSGLELKDNGVTLAKMAGIVKGQIIYGDASGNPAYLAAGADNKALVTNGAGVPLWAAVDNDMLANSAVVVGATSVSLGGTVTAFTGLTGLDFTAADASIAASLAANTLTIGGALSTVKIAGDLQVVGTLEHLNTTELLVEDKTIRIASGSTSDANCDEAGILIGDGGSYGARMFFEQTATIQGQTRANVLKFQNGDGSVWRGIAAKRFIGESCVPVSERDNGNSLKVGVNWFADLGGAEAATLPSSVNSSIGDSIKLKAPSNCSAVNTLTLNTQAGDQKIDGADSIVLESPHAAVELVYVAADQWKVF